MTNQSSKLTPALIKLMFFVATISYLFVGYMIRPFSIGEFLPLLYSYRAIVFGLCMALAWPVIDRIVRAMLKENSRPSALITGTIY